MTYFIPVFVLPLAPGQWTGADPEGEAMALIGAASELRSAGLFQDSSTNWWHVRTSQELAGALGIAGLEFLERHVAVLDPDACRHGSEAVGRVLDALGRQTLPASTSDSIRYEELRAALPDIRVSLRVDEASGDVHSFLQFLVSLRWVLAEADRSGRRVLYYQPQP